MNRRPACQHFSANTRRIVYICVLVQRLSQCKSHKRLRMETECAMSSGETCATTPYFPMTPESGLETPPGRPRPAPLSIPTGSPEEPLFSAYPDSGTRPTPFGKASTAFPRIAKYEVFEDWCAPMAKSYSNEFGTRVELWESALPSVLRKRSATVTDDPPKELKRCHEKAKGDENKLGASFGFRKLPSLQRSRSKTSCKAEACPFPDFKDLLIRQSPKRRSSYDDPKRDGVVGFDLLAVGDGQSPPRRAQSVHYTGTRLSLERTMFMAHERSPAHVDGQSEETHTSAFDEAVSSFSSNQNDALSSATTFFSQSSKNGKDKGHINEKDGLASVRLRRSMLWTDGQKMQRRMEKRRHALLELVDTAVTHADDLTNLAHIYIPQLVVMGVSLPDPFKNTINSLHLFNREMADSMVKILAQEGITYSLEDVGQESQVYHMEADVAERLDRAIKRVARCMLEKEDKFSLYRDYASESVDHGAIFMRHSFTEIQAFELRCQKINRELDHFTLKDLLEDDAERSKDAVGYGSRSKLGFSEYLNSPVSRISQMPLIIQRIMGKPSVTTGHGGLEFETEEVEVELQNLYDMLKRTGAEADEALGTKRMGHITALVRERIEPHPEITKELLQNLGQCQLISHLDVLYQRSSRTNVNNSAAKIKNLAAFLFKGYLILAKVKNRKVYEVKHWLPLSYFEIIDIHAGPIQHAIRLAFNDNIFDLGAACEGEKTIWKKAIVEAREDDLRLPFALPNSTVSRPSRRASMGFTAAYRTAAIDSAPSVPKGTSQDSSAWRHTISLPSSTFHTDRQEIVPLPLPSDLIKTLERVDDHCHLYKSPPFTSSRSPIGSTFNFGSPDRRPSQVYRQPSQFQRATVEDCLSGVISAQCAMARQCSRNRKVSRGNSSEGHGGNFQGSNLSRRKSIQSFLDLGSIRANQNRSYSGKVRGSIVERRGSHQHCASFPSAILQGQLMNEPEKEGEDDETSTVRQSSVYNAAEEGQQQLWRSQSELSFFIVSDENFLEKPVTCQEGVIVGFTTKKEKYRKKEINSKGCRLDEGMQGQVSSFRRRPSEKKRKVAVGQNISNYFTRKSLPTTPLLSPAYEIQSTDSHDSDPSAQPSVVATPNEVDLNETSNNPPPLGRRAYSENATNKVNPDVTTTVKETVLYKGSDYEVERPTDINPSSVSGITFGSGNAKPEKAGGTEKLKMANSLKRSISSWSMRSKSASSISDVVKDREEESKGPSLPTRRKSVRELFGFRGLTRTTEA
ncbi:hypothetical protein L204_102771 [Cryptococcus depauperatus]